MGQETLPYRLVDTFHGYLDELLRNPVFFLPIEAAVCQLITPPPESGEERVGLFVMKFCIKVIWGCQNGVPRLRR